MSEYFKIGKLAASFGLKGELVLEHSLGKKTALKGLEVIFLEDKKDSFIPYFILTAKIKSNNEVYLQLEGIDNKEVARKLTPKEVWITESDFETFAAKSAAISLLGFTMINGGDELGKVIEVIERSGSLSCNIMIYSNLTVYKKLFLYLI